MIFNVEIHRPTPSDCNPFLEALSLDSKVTMLVRTFVVEAESEDEVRQLFKEAQDNDLHEVRGFTIRTIEEQK